MDRTAGGGADSEGREAGREDRQEEALSAGEGAAERRGLRSEEGHVQRRCTGQPERGSEQPEGALRDGADGGVSEGAAGEGLGWERRQAAARSSLRVGEAQEEAVVEAGGGAGEEQREGGWVSEQRTRGGQPEASCLGLRGTGRAAGGKEGEAHGGGEETLDSNKEEVRVLTTAT